MAFRIPNQEDSIEDPSGKFPQAEPDNVDFDILVQGSNGEGVVSGCAVTPDSPESTSVAVASGQVAVAGVLPTVTAGDVDCTAAHGTLPRFDLVVVNNSGTKSVVNGTAETNPHFPEVPANSVALAAVYRVAADDTIDAAAIVDKRVIVATQIYDHAPLGALHPGVLSTGVKPPQVPYRGDPFTVDKLYARVSVAPLVQAITVQIRKGGVSMGTVTIAAAAQTGETDVDVAVVSGDYFDINITQVGTNPNEGSDLVWLLVP